VPDEEAYELKISRQVDFIFPRNNPSVETRQRLLETSQLYQKTGYTVFLSFRTKGAIQGKTIEWNQKLKYRTALAALLRNIPPFPGYEKTSSLLMGKGLGRIQKFPAFNDAITVSQLPAMSVAAVKSPVCEAIFDFLKKSGMRLEMIWVNHFNDLYTGVAAETNAFIGWNDFIGYDPYVSLYNALNPERLLFWDDGTFRSELQEIQNIEDETQKDAAYQKFHFSILEEAAVMPVFSVWQDYYSNKELNITAIKGIALWTVGK
jgi:hypothetical protein